MVDFDIKNLQKKFQMMSDKSEELTSELDKAFAALPKKELKKSDSFQEKVMKPSEERYLGK